jgi:DNA mismatch endonuclease (patch repair protein)
MDIWTREKRSEVMSKIRGTNTKPELLLRSELFREGFRFRIHQKNLPGKPDIVLAKYKTAIFVHGCFWHFHKDCRDGRIPSSNSKFWKEKLHRNITRDAKNVKELEDLGWTVLVIWECQLYSNLKSVVKRLKKNLLAS